MGGGSRVGGAAAGGAVAGLSTFYALIEWGEDTFYYLESGTRGSHFRN